MARGKENKSDCKAETGQKAFLFILFIYSSYLHICFMELKADFLFVLLSSSQLCRIQEAAKTEKGASYLLFRERT